MEIKFFFYFYVFNKIVPLLFFFQSLGCTLYAMCYFVSPFELAHQRGDSVALAVISGIIEFPENTP